MERFENQRWSSTGVAQRLSILESECRFYDEKATTLPVPVATVGADGLILSANRAFQAEFHTGREPGERRTLDFVFRNTPWRHALKRFELATVTAGGYHAVFTPIPHWDRGDTEWSVVFTARPEAPAPSCAAAEPELITTAAGIEAARRLAARVAHETSNLLMIVSGCGRGLLSQLSADSPLRDDIWMLLCAAERIESMAADLNEFARDGRDDRAPQALLPSGDAGLETAIDLTDRTTLLPAIAAGTLQLDATPTAKEAGITVTGVGMSAESLRQQFEVLNRVAREGQAGARECAMNGPKLLQAGVRLRVAEPGALELRLPLAGGRPVAAARSALIVDGQPSIRGIVRRILEGRGFEVADTGTAEEALSLIDRRNEPLSLLVTDMQLSGMSGRDLAGRVRLRHVSTRILFIGGCASDSTIQSGTLTENSCFLSKPFHSSQIIDAVTKLMV